MGIDVGVLRVDGERAGGGAVGDGDGAETGDHRGDTHRGVAQGGGEGHAGGVFSDVVGGQRDRGVVDGVGDLRGGAGGADHQVFKVAASGTGDGGGQAVGVGIDVGVLRVDGERAGGGAVGDGDGAETGDHRGDTHRGVAQGGGEGHAGGVFSDVVGGQRDRGVVSFPTRRSSDLGGADHQVFKVAASGTGDGGGQAVGVGIDVGV